MAYSPDSIMGVFNTVKDAIPEALLGGIYGNKPGYHNCRNQLPSSDYSVQKPDDQVGDGEAASALDITMHTPSNMKRVTQRLIDATKAGDPRLLGLREFFGTVDGYNVTGMDVRGGYYVTSDDSHLWHVHLSFYRKYATNNNACQDIAAVCTGTSGGTSPTPPAGEDDVMDYNTSTCNDDQSINTTFKTLKTGQGANNAGWYISGPAKFIAQALINADGLNPGEPLLVRFYSQDHKDGQDPKRVWTWQTQEIVGTTVDTNGIAVLVGQIAGAASGWERQLRIEARVENGTARIKQMTIASLSQ
jgi:hypothetical protein